MMLQYKGIYPSGGYSARRRQTEAPMEEKIRRLIDTLNAASAAYYGGKSEIMTDHEWDEKFDELTRLENESGIRFPDSPTQRVSEDVIPGQEEPHEYPALSLQKTKSPDDLVKYAGGRSVWVSWKEDGLTLVATYERGRLVRLLTRGNGVVGTRVTHLASCIAGIPDTVNEKGKLVIRGEAVISYADFEAFLLESGEDYQNPRNLASGSFSLKDPAEVRRRRIRFIPFTLVHTDRDIVSWGERLDLLDGLGFTTVEREKVDDPANLKDTVKKWSDRAEKGLSPFPVDGLVVTYDDTVYAGGGSVTGHHLTRGGIAFKWADESADTVLRQVEWSCAASAITPVALFDPVRLEGTTVSRATLHNVSECRRLGLGGAGTRIRVIKANKIIPKVVAVLGAEGVFSVPSVCPVCGNATVLSMSAGGAETLRCAFEGCPGKKIRKLARFVSKAGMDIDGLSVQTLVRLINLGWVREYRDIYALSGHASEMAVLEGFVISGMNATAPPGMDYLLVLGASVYADGPSPALTRRVNAVMDCLDQHPDAVIISSGGQGRNEPISEAQCIRDELIKRGVDPGRILMEDKSTNTQENMEFSKALIDRPDAAVGVVTNNFHIWRSLQHARRAGLTNVHGIAAEYTGPTLIHFMVREAISIVANFLRGSL